MYYIKQMGLWDDIKEGFNDAWNGFKDIVTTVYTFLKIKYRYNNINGNSRKEI
jgi:hypothetical protein